MSREWYLAHATVDRDWVRQLELQWEARYEVDFINPFWDVKREAEWIKAVKDGHASLYGQDFKLVVQQNRLGILTCEKTLAIVSGSFSVGTFGEMAFASSIGKDVITLALNGTHENYWLKEWSNEIYTTVEEFEEMELQ